MQAWERMLADPWFYRFNLREKKSAREKIPVNFLLFTGKPGFAPSQVVPPCPAPGRRSECRLMRRHQAIAAVICRRPSWLNCASIFEVLRKQSQLLRERANKANRQNGSESNVWRWTTRRLAKRTRAGAGKWRALQGRGSLSRGLSLCRQPLGLSCPASAGHPVIPACRIEAKPCQSRAFLFTGSSACADDDDLQAADAP